MYVYIQIIFRFISNSLVGVLLQLLVVSLISIVKKVALQLSFLFLVRVAALIALIAASA